MIRLKSILVAVIVFAACQNVAFADSVSVSASVSAEIKVEVKSETISEPIKKTDGYTGVIVDCRGLGLKRAASPVIRSESGKVIYGDKDLDFDKINEIGMASYATDINDVARAGSKPLMVKAKSLHNFNCNPVLSDADAQRIVFANSIDDFLKDLSVVFLTD